MIYLVRSRSYSTLPASSRVSRRLKIRQSLEFNLSTKAEALARIAPIEMRSVKEMPRFKLREVGWEDGSVEAEPAAGSLDKADAAGALDPDARAGLSGSIHCKQGHHSQQYSRWHVYICAVCLRFQVELGQIA